MKNKLFKYIICLVASGFIWAGCTKKFDELNTDPTAYSQANFNPNYLLTSAQLAYTGSFDFSYETWRANLIYASTMMQQLSTVIGYWAGDKYLLNEAYTSAYWTVAYPEQVKPVVDLVKFTEGKPEYKNLHEIGRLMKAMIFERLTDLYGDIPYFDAGLGYYNKVYFPKYDKQDLIYADLLKEIEEATLALDPNADKPSGDAIFDGNISKWQRFGYSLLLRAGMRLTKVDPAKAQAIVLKVIGKTMINNGDNAFIKHDAAGGRPTVNRNSQVLLGQPEKDYVKWSKKMIDVMKATNDPRLPAIAMTNAVYNAQGEFVSSTTNPASAKGMPNGYDLSGVPGRDISTAPGYTTRDDYSKPSQYLTRLGGPTFILTYAQSELLLADAAQRWTIAGLGTAQTHYNNGVKAAITFMGPYDPAIAIADAAADAFLLGNPYVSANGLEMINTQYFIHTATMFDFYEDWSNWRRTGFPVLTPVNYPGNVTGGTVPRRFPYPLSEANTNPTNYQAAHSSVPGGDNLAGRVWWDKP